MKLLAATPYCVYAHSIEGVIFYIGAGEIYRAFTPANRKPRWHARVSGKDFDVDVISLHATRQDARAAEKAMILDLKPDCNSMHNDYCRSPAERAAISKANKGRKHTDAARVAMSLKRRMAHAAGVHLGHQKQIVCVETGIVFKSIRDASAAMMIARSSISRCCSGKTKIVSGYTFKSL